MGSRKIEVQLVGDSRSLERAFGKSSKAGKTWGSSLKSAGKVAGLGIAAGIGIAAIALKKSVDAAKEAEIAQSKMVTQLNASVPGWRKYEQSIDATISGLSRLTAFDDEELQDSFTNIVRSTKDVGEAFELNALAADIARGANIDLTTASKLVTKVAAGQTSALSRYGIVLEKGATKQEAIAELQKRFAGQAENYGKSTAGAQDRFAVALENVQEKIGQKLLPALTKLFEWGTQFMTWSETNWPRFSAAVTDAIDKVRPYFEALVSYWNDTLLPTIESIVELARGFWGKFGEDIRRIFTNVVSIIRNLLNVAKGIIELVMALIRGDWSAAWTALKLIATNAMQALLTYLKTIVTNFLHAGRAIGAAIKDGIMAGISALAGLLASAVRGAINAVISAIRGFGIPGFKIDPPGPGSFSFPGVHPFAGIPSLDTGGLVTRTGLAQVHRGETFSGVSSGRGGGRWEIALIAAGPDVIRQLRELERRGRRGGAPAF